MGNNLVVVGSSSAVGILTFDVLFKDIETILNKWRCFPEISLYISLLLWGDILLMSEGLNIQVLELWKIKVEGYTEISSLYPAQV